MNPTAYDCWGLWHPLSGLRHDTITAKKDDTWRLMNLHCYQEGDKMLSPEDWQANGWVAIQVRVKFTPPDPLDKGPKGA